MLPDGIRVTTSDDAHVDAGTAILRRSVDRLVRGARGAANAHCKLLLDIGIIFRRGFARPYLQGPLESY